MILLATSMAGAIGIALITLKPEKISTKEDSAMYYLGIPKSSTVKVDLPRESEVAFTKEDTADVLTKYSVMYNDKCEYATVYIDKVENSGIFNRNITVNPVEMIDVNDINRLKETGILTDSYEPEGAYELYDSTKESILYKLNNNTFSYLLDDNCEKYVKTDIEGLKKSIENDNKRLRCFHISFSDDQIVGIVEQYIQ